MRSTMVDESVRGGVLVASARRHAYAADKTNKKTKKTNKAGMNSAARARARRAARRILRIFRFARASGKPPDDGGASLRLALGWVISGLAPLALLALTLRGALLAGPLSMRLGAPLGPGGVAGIYGLIILAFAALALAIWGWRPAVATLAVGALGLVVIITVWHVAFAALAGWIMLDVGLVVVLAIVAARLAWTERELARLKREMADKRALAAARSTSLDTPALDDQSRMDAFIGQVSHELRTPLTTIKASVQLGLRKLSRARQPEFLIEDLRDLLTRTDQQVARMTRQIEDLLDTTRFASGQLMLRYELCDLLALTREAVHEARLRAPGRMILLESDEATALVWGDPARLRQVIERYLANALKFSGSSQPVVARVWGRWRAAGSGAEGPALARVAVRDYGPGIAPEALERVWDRFYQDPELAEQVGSEVGLGLGLYLCRAIIEAHHGAVGVENASAGGALIWFTLPVAPA